MTPSTHLSPRTRVPPARATGPLASWLLLMCLCACSRSESDRLAGALSADPFERSLTAAALGEPAPAAGWEDPDAVSETLIVLLDDIAEEVSQHAAASLKKHGLEVFPALLANAGRPTSRVPELIAEMALQLGEAALPQLVTALEQAHPPGGALLVNTLGSLGASGQAAVLQASHHEHERVRRAACTILSKTARPGNAEFERLEAALDDESPPIRGLAQSTVIRAWNLQLKAPRPELRREAEQQLAALGAVALRHMAQLALDNRPASTGHTRAWLRARGPEHLPGMLLAFQGTSDELDVARLPALLDLVAEFGEGALPVLLGELTAADSRRRTAAAAALGALGPRADAARPQLLSEALPSRAQPDSPLSLQRAAAHSLMLIGETDPEILQSLAAEARVVGGMLENDLGMAACAGVLRLAGRAQDPAQRMVQLRAVLPWGDAGLEWMRRLALYAYRADIREQAQTALVDLGHPLGQGKSEDG